MSFLLALHQFSKKFLSPTIPNVQLSASSLNRCGLTYNIAFGIAAMEFEIMFLLSYALAYVNPFLIALYIVQQSGQVHFSTVYPVLEYLGFRACTQIVNLEGNSLGIIAFCGLYSE